LQLEGLLMATSHKTLVSSRVKTQAQPLRESATPKKSDGKSTQVRWGNAAQAQELVREAKRLALIRAAGVAFKARGFHNTSLDNVAAALNVTKPSLYYHIKNKQDLLYQCHSHALDLGDVALEYAQSGITGLEKLQRMLRRYMELITDDFSSYSLLSDLNDLPTDQRAAIQERRQRFDSAFRDFIRQGMKDGSIRKCDPKLTVAWFMGSVNAIPRWFATDGRLSGAEVARIYTDLITRSLQPDRSYLGKC